MHAPFVPYLTELPSAIILRIHFRLPPASIVGVWPMALIPIVTFLNSLRSRRYDLIVCHFVRQWGGIVAVNMYEWLVISLYERAVS